MLSSGTSNVSYRSIPGLTTYVTVDLLPNVVFLIEVRSEIEAFALSYNDLWRNSVESRYASWLGVR